jgi:alanyl-tRNA synthetase
VLGAHVKQAGSLVEAGRLRFDFNHHKALTKEEIREIEKLVNEKIWENKPLKTYELPLEEVQNHPDIKQFFGDKYGKTVRVVDIDGYSKELCGGTHVNTVGEIGYFRIAKEGSIAKGVRRIEAVTGKEGEKLRYALEDLLDSIASTVKGPLDIIEETLQTLMKENEHFREQSRFARKKHLSDLAAVLMTQIKKVGAISLLSATIDIERKELNELGNDLLERMGAGVLLLSVIEGEDCQLYLRVSSDLVQKGIHANTLIQSIADLIDGRGGGKKEMAQAGGKNPEGVPIAFDKIQEILTNY